MDSSWVCVLGAAARAALCMGGVYLSGSTFIFCSFWELIHYSALTGKGICICVYIYIYLPQPLLCSLLTLITITFETRGTPNISIQAVFFCSFGKRHNGLRTHCIPNWEQYLPYPMSSMDLGYLKTFYYYWVVFSLTLVQKFLYEFRPHPQIKTYINE